VILFSSDASRASACPDTVTGFPTTRTGPAATASPARLTTATAGAPARSTRLKKKFASKFCQSVLFFAVLLTPVLDGFE
jgi:hypothetical protein